MNRRTVHSDALLLCTACIWGFAFVAQRMGMDHVGPFTFNGVRFALGALTLVPFLRSGGAAPTGPPEGRRWSRTVLGGGLLAGGALFTGASLQQVGLVYTTAGNAGFITGLYVVIVPIMGLVWRQRPAGGTWAGAGLAAVGLYLLSVTSGLHIAYGDLLELLGAFCWAAHVLLIGWLSPRVHALRLAVAQYVTCAVLSLVVAVAAEPIVASRLMQAGLPIIYGGVFSVGVAYTLQVVAQKSAHPAHTAVLLSSEAVFAALGGWLVLGEQFSRRGLVGCGLMLSGMLLSQLCSLRRAPRIVRGRTVRTAGSPAAQHPPGGSTPD